MRGKTKMEEKAVIEIKDLVKDYGQGRGVFGVSFSIMKGECFGFLGPNGAGKSTTIRHLMGFAKPQSGHTYINGVDTLKNRDKVLQSVSYLPGEIELPAALTGKEFIEEQKSLKGVIDDTFLNWLIDTFKLDPTLLCKEMSLGMKRKLAIVCCFMSDPDIIIMDEPSSGLDPDMQKVFINLIKAEKKRGKTMLMSSHIFAEIDSCCDRIAVIKDGNIVSLFKADDLKHKTDKTYEITFSKVECFNQIKNEQTNFYKVVDSDVEKRRLVLSTNDKDINHFIRVISPHDIEDVHEIKETLEDYFMSFYKEEKSFRGI